MERDRLESKLALVETIGFAFFVVVIVFLIVKEVAAYRLPATHALNRFMNPPHRGGSGGSGGYDAHPGGYDGDPGGCDGGD